MVLYNTACNSFLSDDGNNLKAFGGSHVIMKKFLAWMTVLTLVLTMLPMAPVYAAESVAYINTSGTEQTVAATAITSANAMQTLSSGWYYVAGEVNTGTILVNGDVNIILTDGCHLTADGWASTPNGAGIAVSPANTLTIYVQSGGTGALTAKGSEGNAVLAAAKAILERSPYMVGILLALGGNFAAGIAVVLAVVAGC